MRNFIVEKIWNYLAHSRYQEKKKHRFKIYFHSSSNTEPITIAFKIESKNNQKMSSFHGAVGFVLTDGKWKQKYSTAIFLPSSLLRNMKKVIPWL